MNGVVFLAQLKDMLILKQENGHYVQIVINVVIIQKANNVMKILKNNTMEEDQLSFLGIIIIKNLVNIFMAMKIFC